MRGATYRRRRRKEEEEEKGCRRPAQLSFSAGDKYRPHKHCVRNFLYEIGGRTRKRRRRERRKWRRRRRRRRP